MFPTISCFFPHSTHPSLHRIRIFSIWNKMESLHFMVQIKYHKFNSVQTTTSFKILNDKAVYISLDLWNKILTMKWTNGEISKWRGSLSPHHHLSTQPHSPFFFTQLFFSTIPSIHPYPLTVFFFLHYTYGSLLLVLLPLTLLTKRTNW